MELSVVPEEPVESVTIAGPAHAFDSPGGVDDCASADEFPAWYYAEIKTGGEPRVVSLFHVNTHAGLVPYWYEDPESKYRGLPLLKTLEPVLLGDYGSYLAKGSNMQTFVALCKTLDDLPDPLLAVQVIRSIERRQEQGGVAAGELGKMVVQALQSNIVSQRKRRAEFNRVMDIITGNLTAASSGLPF